MRIALASRWIPEATPTAETGALLRSLGLDLLHLSRPPSAAAPLKEALLSVGVRVCSVGADPEVGVGLEDVRKVNGALERAASAASALRAGVVVVEGGVLGGRAEAALAAHERKLRDAVIRGEAPDASGVAALRAGAREAAAERAVRALHGPLSRGVPLAIRNGDGVHDLLGLEETGWLLDELPRLGFWFDAARAFRGARTGSGPTPLVWTERLASRTGGVFAHGLSPSLEGGSHPEDVAPPWSTLAEVLPRGVPWVLDVAPSLSPGDVSEAARYLGSLAR